MRVGRGELRGDGHVPQPWVGERGAFYGIFLGHEHRKSIGECHLRRGERMVIGERVLDDLHAVSAQLGEEALRVAYAGHAMHALSME